ncbi:MAG: multidrug ABC transporter substrate-binding protein [Chlorobiaceae bacterium]|nr:multidrug ABC transporter substrate-binding protein [Chlorobiaceae bacterium]
MRFIEILRIAFDALLRNKMRSLLTMLGIIIGVGAVIAMVAIGQGAQVQVEAQISSLGSNILLVFPGTTTRGGVMAGAGTGSTITEEDGQAVKEQCPAVAYVSPLLRSGAQVVYANLNWGTVIQGGAVDFFSIRDFRLQSGDYFTEQDVRAATKVCLLGKTVVDQLFESADPVGQTVRIRNIPFRVIGTLQPKGQNAMGQDQDDIIIIPYTTLQKRLMGHTRSWGFIVSAVSKAQISAAQQQITDLLRVRHKLGPMDDNDFTIRTQTEIADAQSATANIMTILLASIASISLLVGGIGIMNIMLVSVTERTREIGIRISIGARQRDILTQFLMEAIVMSLLGGLIGILFGVIASNLVSKFAGWPTFVTAQSIIMAVSFSMAVGVFFGYYPARKASGLNPIDALRYE